jgi:hypothetical protein
LTDEPLDEPPARLASEWQRRALDPGACHVLPIGGSLNVSVPDFSGIAGRD